MERFASDVTSRVAAATTGKFRTRKQICLMSQLLTAVSAAREVLRIYIVK